MRTRPGIIPNHIPVEYTQILAALLIAVTLVGPFRSPLAGPAIISESMIVLQTAGAPLLEITSKKKGDLKCETKESIQ